MGTMVDPEKSKIGPVSLWLFWASACFSTVSLYWLEKLPGDVLSGVGLVCGISAGLIDFRKRRSRTSLAVSALCFLLLISAVVGKLVLA